MNWLFLGLILLYFFSGLHSRVLAHFGLTRRDDRLIWIGFFIPGVLSGIVALYGAAVAGTGFLTPVIILLIHCGFIYLNYKSL
jgi:hypothetical protein